MKPTALWVEEQDYSTLRTTIPSRRQRERSRHPDQLSKIQTGFVNKIDPPVLSSKPRFSAHQTG